MNLPSHKKYSPPAKLKMIALCAFIASTNAAAYTINPGDTVIVDGLGGGTQTSPWVMGTYETLTVNGTMEQWKSAMQALLETRMGMVLLVMVLEVSAM